METKTDTNIYTFNIWMEGFRATGESASAHLVATNVEGENFIDACKQFYKNDLLFRINEKGTPSYWGCRLFDNEAEARKTFG